MFNSESTPLNTTVTLNKKNNVITKKNSCNISEGTDIFYLHTNTVTDKKLKNVE